MTSVSVVIPTYNRWVRLEQVLAGLARQTVAEPEMEIIVVSDGSTDETDENLEQGRAPIPVEFLRQANAGPAAARNAGVAAATGELLLFIDDDVVPAPECVAVHVEAHQRAAEPIVVIGPLLTPESAQMEPWVKWEQRMLYKQYDAMERGAYWPTARQFYSGNASVLRRCFIAVGGFDESYRRAEDLELAYRLGGYGLTFQFEIAARAFHHADRSYDSWLAIAHAYGASDVRFWRDHGQDWLIPRIRSEYDQRSPLNRGSTRLGFVMPGFAAATYSFAPRWARLMDRLGTKGSGRRVLSAAYNLSYYEGLAGELGGIEEFLAITPAKRGEAPPV